ncbi:MAG TPA: rhodanese-like domain-containing protein [Anaerolineales bacterium]|jgi:rhodanese-related sulfurtransferase|nr:rhodanese-like domain-containing protein [Anaerolineales bacterium]
MAKRTNKMKKQQQNNRNLLFGLVGVILVGVVGVVVLSGPADSAPVQANALPMEVSVQDAFSMREEGAFILDVRNQDEWDAGHVPGATLIPLPQLASRLAELPQDQEIVVICRSGNRSATARDILLDAGFSSVTSVAGGFNDWARNGFDVEVGP